MTSKGRHIKISDTTQFLDPTQIEVKVSKISKKLIFGQLKIVYPLKLYFVIYGRKKF